MINKLKSLTNSDDKKRLIENFFSLSVLQGANYILPLITFPYLVRVLGVEKFGLLAFANSTIAYFNILTDYGFNLTATREVSIYRNDREKLNEIFSSVMIIKFILMVLSFILLCVLIFTFQKFKQDYIVYLLTFGMVVGQVLFPQWFFQGMEKMKYITFLNILAKSIFTIAIFVFIHKESDCWKVPLINSLGFISAGIISLFLIKKEFKIRFKLQNLEILKDYFVEGWHIFISRIAVVLYTSSNIFILGLFTNNTLVGYYSIAEKVISAVSSLASIINQVLFPYLSKIWKMSINNYYMKFKLIFRNMIFSMIAIAILLYLSAPFIIQILSGKEIEESTAVLRILAVTVILFPLGGLFTQSFVTQKENKYIAKVTIYTMIINLLLVFLLIKLYGVYGLALTVVIVQLFQVVINGKYFLYLKGKTKCVE